MKYFILGLKNYFETEGRTTRKEYWFFSLYSIVLGFFLSIADGIFNLTYHLSPEQNLGITFSIYSLFILCPSVTIQIRRLHDIGKQWTWFLLCFIPIVGNLILFYFNVQPSQPIENSYGPGSREVERLGIAIWFAIALTLFVLIAGYVSTALGILDVITTGS